MATINKLERIKGDHCSSCGSTRFKTDDGYTLCCNKSVCSGGHAQLWKHEDTGKEVRACCWAGAEIEWRNKYGETMPEGSYSW